MWFTTYVLTFMPAVSFANSYPEARIGNVTYGTLTEAIHNVKDGETIVLLREVSTAVNITRGKFKIDLAGNNLKSQQRPISASGKNVELTIVSSSDGIQDANHNAVVQNVTNNGVGSVLAKDGATVIVEAGYYYAFNGNKAGMHAYNDGTIIFRGGVVNGAPHDPNGNPDYNQKPGKVFYSGVNYENSSESYGRGETEGLIIVEDGIFDGRISNSNWGRYEIKGGSFKKNEIQNYDNPRDEEGKPTGTSTPSGKTMTFEESGWVAKGYKVIKEGEWTKIVFDQELDDAKNAAVSALDSVDQSKYSEPELSKVKKAIEDAKTVIAAAKNVEEVNSAKSAADEIIKAQKTTAEKDLAAAKKNAIDALNKVNLKSYIEPERSKVKAAINNSKKKINAATTVAAVNKAKAAANKTIKAQAKYNSKLPRPVARYASGFKGYLRARWYKLSKKNRNRIKGFEVQYSTDKNFKNYKIARAQKTNSVKTVYKVPGKKKFWVRSRVYTINKKGVKTVGAWSKVRTLKTK